MYQKQKYNVYPVHKDIFTFFLKENGYTATYIGENDMRFENDNKHEIIVPRVTETYTKEEIKYVLSSANLEFKEFEWFLTSYPNDFDAILKTSEIKPM